MSFPAINLHLFIVNFPAAVTGGSPVQPQSRLQDAPGPSVRSAPGNPPLSQSHPNCGCLAERFGRQKAVRVAF